MAMMDDAVTAFRNGEVLKSMMYGLEYVERYRAGYIFGRTYPPLGHAALKSEKRGSEHDGIEDALFDLKMGA